MNNILVTGSSGQMGTIVIETLLKKMAAQQIHVITRKEEKRLEMQARGLQAFIGDYGDVASLEKAMEGVDTVLLISSGDQGDRMQEHKNVVDAAKKIWVTSIAYTSRSLKDRATLTNTLMEEHFATEDYIKQSGLKYIFFRNALYMEVLLYYVGKTVFEGGGFSQVAGNGKVAFTLRKDLSEAMANVLLNEAFNNQVYKFTANETYSFYDVAAVLSELSGKAIKYVPVEVPVYKELMKEQGLPEVVVNKIINFNVDIKNDQESTVTHDLEIKLGRKPATLKEGLKILFNL
ncbi:MAG: SDR family oxidoreductase [Bacteroidetes bacterium]|nr:SDR family oxidoreductase [Bacteroidota bacterium]